MLRSLDLNTASEKNAAHLFGQQTMNRLSANDASLPQVISTVEMVKRGIGVVRELKLNFKLDRFILQSDTHFMNRQKNFSITVDYSQSLKKWLRFFFPEI